MKLWRIFKGPFVLLFFLVPFLFGCEEKRPEGMPQLCPVTLEFTQDGAPCVGASVQLVADGEAGKWPIGGSTDAGGKARLMTYGKYDGAPEGNFKIVVSKVERERIGPEPTSMYDSSGEETYNLIDPLYGQKDTTTLEIEVVKGKKYESFELGTPVREKLKKPGE